MNASNREKVIGELDTAVRQKGKGWTGYLVTIIPKTSSRYDNKIITASRPIYEIDGASFYSKATGHYTALYDLFNYMMEVLPEKFTSEISNEIKGYCSEVWRSAFGNEKPSI